MLGAHFGPVADSKQLTVSDADLWLNADLASSVKLNASVVTSWEDNSGNGHDFAPPLGGGSPGYMTARNVQFDGSQALQNASLLPNTDALILFIVFQRNGLALDYPLLNIPVNAQQLDVAVDLTSVIVSYGNPLNPAMSADVGELAQDHVLLTVQMSGLLSTPTTVIRVNGVDRPTSIAAPRGVLGLAKIAYRDIPLEQRFQGHIHEIAMYARAIDDDDRADTEALLIDRWDL